MQFIPLYYKGLCASYQEFTCSNWKAYPLQFPINSSCAPSTYWNTKGSSLYLGATSQASYHYWPYEAATDIILWETTQLLLHDVMGGMLHSIFGLLHCGEFTTQGTYDPQVHLSFKDLAVDNKCSPTHIRLCIKQSKTDCFRHGSFVYLGKTDSEICLVRAILQHLSARGAVLGPFFLSEKSETTHYRAMFSSAVSNLLRELGLQASLYNTHSFQIGTAI